jgi:phosphonate degradation associated HDIG domain protein
MAEPDVIDAIFSTFARRGSEAYLGEEVSLTEHMLQTAVAAEQDGAEPILVASALLHDYGHLVHELPEDAAEHGIDTEHEEAGAAWLERHFVCRLTEPLRLHVLAKRYLCATEPEYLRSLSPASLRSLRLQGGPCAPEEVDAFRRNPYAEDAVLLRRWDDVGKTAGLDTPPLEHYRPALEAGLRWRTRARSAGSHTARSARH